MLGIKNLPSRGPFIDTTSEHFALWNEKSTPDALSTGALSIEDADRLMEGFVGAKLLYSQEVVDTKKVWVAMMKIAGRLADELREDAEIEDPLPKPKAKPAPVFLFERR